MIFLPSMKGMKMDEVMEGMFFIPSIAFIQADSFFWLILADLKTSPNATKCPEGFWMRPGCRGTCLPW